MVGIGTIGAAWLQKRDYRMLLEFLKEYGIDINPKHRGITEVMFVRAWLFAREVRKERYTVLNNMEMMPKRMREDMFKELYALMCRIWCGKFYYLSKGIIALQPKNSTGSFPYPFAGRKKNIPVLFCF